MHAAACNIEQAGRHAGRKGAAARNAIHLLMREDVLLPLVHIRLCTAVQGTSPNEKFHRYCWQNLRNLGGSRSYQLLATLLMVMVHTYKRASCLCVHDLNCFLVLLEVLSNVLLLRDTRGVPRRGHPGQESRTELGAE
jgi:hypothetical protein